MRYDYCTYFDKNYLARGIALYRSLEEHLSDYRLFVLCLDSDCFDILRKSNLPRLTPIALEDLESGDRALLEAKKNRNRVEYYFTITPSLPLYIFSRFSEVELLTYLDADLYFFQNPAPLFEELKDGSVAIIGHRFPPGSRHREVYGVYNVGWLTFRRGPDASKVLGWWREACIDWCYDRVEDGRFADQKYLDDWPERFPGVRVLTHKGGNLAPWNIGNYRISHDETGVRVDDQPLIFFHFHGLKRLNRWMYDPNLFTENVKLSQVVKDRIYLPYLNALAAAETMLPGRRESLSKKSTRYDVPGLSMAKRIRKSLSNLVYLTRIILDRNYILKIDGKAR